MKKITTIIIILCLGVSTTLFAADGTWNVDADGDWSTVGNWVSDIPADGAGSTANFAYDITEERQVTLDSARTIGNINFDDGGGMQTINFRITGGNTLTLDNSGSTPIVSVTNLWAGFIGVPLAGNAGFIKTGDPYSRLILDQDNSISGQVTVKSGYLTAYNNKALTNADVVIDGGVLEIAPNFNANIKSVIANNGIGDLGLIKPYPDSFSELTAPLTLNFPDSGNTFAVNVDVNSSLNLNGDITLMANTAMAITGGDAYLNINAPVSGNYNLRLLGRWNYEQINTFNINAQCSHASNTTFEAWGANPMFKMGVNNAIPCGGKSSTLILQVDNSVSNASVTLDLNGYTQKVNNLTFSIDGNQQGHEVIITDEYDGMLEITNTLFSWEAVPGNTVIKLIGGKIVCNGPGCSLNTKMVIEKGTFINNGSWWGGPNAYFDLKIGAKVGGTGFLGWENIAASNLVITSGATITPGNSIGTLGCWNLEMQSGSLYDWEIENGTSSDLVDVRGLLNISGAAVNSITVNVSVIGGIDEFDLNTLFYTANGSEGISGNTNSVFLSYEPGITGPEHPLIDVNTNMVVSGIVPEPATLGLIAILGLAFFRRK
ncbi:PEP-CTERM sorting domain-containing protein [bacterium]|nr:PEP-CTERM sorting domain-containing protein [bacterium]